jgi:hypothetical protein
VKARSKNEIDGKEEKGGKWKGRIRDQRDKD